MPMMLTTMTPGHKTTAVRKPKAIRSAGPAVLSLFGIHGGGISVILGDQAIFFYTLSINNYIPIRYDLSSRTATCQPQYGMLHCLSGDGRCGEVLSDER